MRLRFIFFVASFALLSCEESVKDEVKKVIGYKPPAAAQAPPAKTWKKGTDGGAVNAMAVLSKDEILLGGEFTAIEGVESPYLAKVDRSGQAVVDFAKNIGTGPNGPVLSISVHDGYFYVGGEFDSFNENPVGNIVCLHPNGKLNRTCTENLQGGANGPVEKIRKLKDRTAFAGDFTEFGGHEIGYLAMIDSHANIMIPNVETDSK